MKIEYSKHAEKRLKERNISKNKIKSALVDFDKIDRYEFNKYISQKLVKGKLLNVVFTKDKEYYKIITAYYEN